MTDHADAFIATIDLRVREILDRCTRCAKCVEVCPTAAPAGIDISEPAAIVGDVLDILRGGGDPSSRGARWANACTGSGRCIPRATTALTRVSCWRRPASGSTSGGKRANGAPPVGPGSRKCLPQSRCYRVCSFPPICLPASRERRRRFGPGTGHRHVSRLQRSQDAPHRAVVPRSLGSSRHPLQSFCRAGLIVAA